MREPSALRYYNSKAHRHAGEVYKAAKVDANGADKLGKEASVEDEPDEDDVAGPELPPDFDQEDVPDDEEGRFFGGGVTRDTTSALDFVDKQDESGAGVAIPLPIQFEGGELIRRN